MNIDYELFQSAITSFIYEEAGISVQEKDFKSRPNLSKHKRTRITGGPGTTVWFLGVSGLETTSDEKSQDIEIEDLEISKDFCVERFFIWGHLQDLNPHAFHQISIV